MLIDKGNNLTLGIELLSICHY